MTGQQDTAVNTCDAVNTSVSRMGPEQTARFVGKVYFLLILSIAIAVGGCMAGMAMEVGYKSFWTMFLTELAALFFLIWVREVPVVNLLALFLFTGLTGLTLSPVIAMVFAAGLGHLVWIAAGLTTVIFTGLSAYVLVTGRNFSYMGGTLFVLLLVLLVFSVLNLFFGGDYSKIGATLACLGVALFSGYILYDTSLLIHVCDPNDYILATINLYLDILNLFVDFLRILIEWGRDVEWGSLLDVLGAIDL